MPDGLREMGRRLAEALFDQGLDLLAAGDAAAAIDRLRGAVWADPGHRDAAHALIRALDASGRVDEALQRALDLVARAPDDVLARTSLSMIYQRMGKIAEAEKAALDAKLLGWKLELREGRDGASSEPELAGAGNVTALRIYVASSNAGKLRDFAVGSGGRVALEPLPGLAAIAPPPEDELTFAGNAGVKAVYYSGFVPGEVVVADDSGLEVDALDGRPGVRSARFAGDLGFAGEVGDSLDARNNGCLLRELAGVANRRARYRCALAAARDGVVLYQASGDLAGRILAEPRGTGGFGYDPLFFVEELGAAMAQLAPEDRLAVSHRGRALAALMGTMEAEGFFAM